MEKIGESPWTILTDVEESHHTVALNNKIWLFSKKYVPQVSHNFGHHVTYRGGYSTFFGLESKKWSQRFTYPALCDEENLEEVLFVLKSRIFLLLYTHFGGVCFRHLYLFDEANRTWHQIKSFEVNENCNDEVSATWKTDLVYVNQASFLDDSLFIASNEFSVTFLKLSMNDNMDAKLSLIYKQTRVDKLKRPVCAARIMNKIFWLEGVHGCGFRIQPNTLKVYDMESKQQAEHKINGDHPPFSYTGARCTKLFSSGEWIHATGDIAVGMTSVKFCGQVWSLILNGPSYTWKKLEAEVPECDNVKMLAVMSEDKLLYIIDPKSGVSMLQI